MGQLERAILNHWIPMAVTPVTLQLTLSFNLCGHGTMPYVGS